MAAAGAPPGPSAPSGRQRTFADLLAQTPQPLPAVDLSLRSAKLVEMVSTVCSSPRRRLNDRQPLLDCPWFSNSSSSGLLWTLFGRSYGVVGVWILNPLFRPCERPVMCSYVSRMKLILCKLCPGKQMTLKECHTVDSIGSQSLMRIWSLRRCRYGFFSLGCPQIFIMNLA